MINDLSIPSDDFEGDMFKYADDTNVSEYIFNLRVYEFPARCY